MIISTNSARFYNFTEDNTGKLTNLESSRTTAFLGFKPAAVCKKAGHLVLTIYGSVYLHQDNMLVNLDVGITAPGTITYPFPVISDALLMQGLVHFNAHINIPVEAFSRGDDRSVFTTSHVGNTTAIHRRDGYIFVDTDQVIIMEFLYNIAGAESIPASSVAVYNVIAEYKEN